MCIKLALWKANRNLFLELSLCMYSFIPLLGAGLDLLRMFVLTPVAISKEGSDFIASEDFE
jgi:hypothetical protein